MCSIQATVNIQDVRGYSVKTGLGDKSAGPGLPLIQAPLLNHRFFSMFPVLRVFLLCLDLGKSIFLNKHCPPSEREHIVSNLVSSVSLSEMLWVIFLSREFNLASRTSAVSGVSDPGGWEYGT